MAHHRRRRQRRNVSTATATTVIVALLSTSDLRSRRWLRPNLVVLAAGTNARTAADDTSRIMPPPPPHHNHHSGRRRATNAATEGDENSAHNRRRSSLAPAAPTVERTQNEPQDNVDDSDRVDDRPRRTTTMTSRRRGGKRRRSSKRITSDGIHELRNLVVLIRFSDHVDREVPAREKLDALFNAEGGHSDLAPGGSLWDFFSSNSYGKLDVTSSFATFPSSALFSSEGGDELNREHWMTLSRDESYYAESNHGLSRSSDMVLEALERLESIGFPFDQYDLDGDGAIDGFQALHSGHGAEYGGNDCHGTPHLGRIWSHKDSLGWTSKKTGISVPMYSVTSASRGRCGADAVRVGVLVHEMGHFRGLPDLYDETLHGLGVGCYDAMSNSWGFDGTGARPPNLSAWSRVKLGYVRPRIVGREGKYSIAASELEPQVYRIDAGFPLGEYLLVENRQPIGFDADVPGGGGLAVWHIDESKRGQEEAGHPFQSGWPLNGRHYRVALLQADGQYDLERSSNGCDGGDLWRKEGAEYGARRSLGPGSDGLHPSTDAYRDGDVVETGVRIFDVSRSGDVMTFKISGPNFKAAEGIGNDGDPFVEENKKVSPELFAEGGGDVGVKDSTAGASQSFCILLRNRSMSPYGFLGISIIMYTFSYIVNLC